MSGGLAFDLAAFGALVAVIAIAGLAFGIFFVAPRLTRREDRTDEERHDRDE